MNPDLSFSAMRAYIDLGEFKHAREMADHIMNYVYGKKITDPYVAEAYLGLRQMRRLTGAKGLSASEWKELFAVKKMRASQRFVVEVLSGRLSREEGLKKVPDVVDGGELHYWLALEDLASGNIAAAVEALTTLIATHPRWEESNSARCLLRAIDEWDAEERARYEHAVAPGPDTPPIEKSGDSALDEF